MNYVTATALLLCWSLLLVGCANQSHWRYVAASVDEQKTIYMVNHGWHTGLVIPASMMHHDFDFLPQDFVNAQFYEIGWGDKGFYQADEITFSLAVKTLLWPTESVMHVVALPSNPEKYFSNSRVLAVPVSSQGLDKLIAFIERSFKRDESGLITKSQKGLYGDSAFYAAEGRYHLTNTCNSWVARALYQAGVPIRPSFSITASSVEYQTQRALQYYVCCDAVDSSTVDMP